MVLDDNVTLIIYYDEAQRFGVVWNNQDDGDLYTDYLDVMLKQSPAQHSLAQILGCMTFILSIPYITYESQRQLISDLRAVRQTQ